MEHGEDEPGPSDVAYLTMDRDGCILFADEVARYRYERDGPLVGRSALLVLGEAWLGPSAHDALVALRRDGSWRCVTDHQSTAGTVRAAVRADRWLTSEGVTGGVQLRSWLVTSDDERDREDGLDIALMEIDRLAGHGPAAALRDIVARLVAASSTEDVCAITCTGSVEGLGALGGHVVVRGDDGQCHTVCSAGYRAEHVEGWVPLDIDAATAERTALVDGAATWLFAIPPDEVVYLPPSVVGVRALCVVPIQLRDRPFGALALSFAEKDAFSVDERSFVRAVAHAAALAIDRIALTENRLSEPVDVSTTEISLQWNGGERVELYATRAWVRTLLADQSTEVINDAALCASELLTNAVEHAGAPRRLRLERSREALHIAADDSTRDSLPRLREPDSNGGRGLRIIDRVASDWGTTPRPWGKTTWATLRLDAATS